MSSITTKDNIKTFRIQYDSQYIQIYPLINSFKTQIIIDKRTADIVFKDKNIDFIFHGDYTRKFASLIIGIIQIQQQHFLTLAQKVYPECALPPQNVSIYQLATIQYVSFRNSVSKQAKQILQTIQKV